MDFQRTFKQRLAKEQLLAAALNDKVVLTTIFFWLLGILASFVVIVYFYPRIPFEVPLFYSHVFGKTQLAPKNLLLLLPAGTFVLGVFNLLWALAYFTKDKIISYLLLSGTAIVTTLTTLSVANIVRLMI